MVNFDIVIIGGGISGIIAAIEISKLKCGRVLILEKGESYYDRITAEEPNCIEGLGGSGTVYGGKLCYPPASAAIWKKTLKMFTQRFPEMLSEYLGVTDQDISFAAENPMHISLNGCYEKKYVSELLDKGEMINFTSSLIAKAVDTEVEIRSQCRVIGYYRDGAKRIVQYIDPNGFLKSIVADYVIFAGGRSSALEVPLLLKECMIKAQAPDLGIRVIMPREISGIFSKVGQDVKIKKRYKNMIVRTFCVCSGGSIAKVRLNNLLYYDGHFGHHITDKVNFGVLTRSCDIVGTEAALKFVEDYQFLSETPLSANDFFALYKDIATCQEHINIFDSISDFLSQLVNENAILGGLEDLQVLLPSVDRLNPFVQTNEMFQTMDSHLFVVGDATGISRGFVQAMWSGYCAASGIAVQIQKEENKAIS